MLNLRQVLPTGKGQGNPRNESNGVGRMNSLEEKADHRGCGHSQRNGGGQHEVAFGGLVWHGFRQSSLGSKKVSWPEAQKSITSKSSAVMGIFEALMAQSVSRPGLGL